MKSLLTFSLALLFFVGIGCSTDTVNEEQTPETEFNANAEALYFPPTDSETWETVSLRQLEWNEEEADELYDYLERKNTKGFIILYKGRIVVEKYFNGHSQDASWPWYSAAKSLTATFVGIAQDEGLLDIENRTSDYLGSNWTTLDPEQENLITVRNHLSMTTGLTDYLGQTLKWICNRPDCLEYTADAGERWAYHQGAFMLLQEMITVTSGMSFEDYCKIKIADQIGMEGAWTSQLGLNIYNSNTRSMARFGLLSMNKGTWGDIPLLSEDYFNVMVNSSQELNKAYGYCWWLNGKKSFLNISSNMINSGTMTPNAPADMFAALGSQDQKIYVVPSKDLVVIRSGERAAESELGASSFDNELWAEINAVID